MIPLHLHNDLLFQHCNPSSHTGPSHRPNTSKTVITHQILHSPNHANRFRAHPTLQAILPHSSKRDNGNGNVRVHNSNSRRRTRRSAGVRSRVARLHMLAFWPCGRTQVHMNMQYFSFGVPSRAELCYVILTVMWRMFSVLLLESLQVGPGFLWFVWSIIGIARAERDGWGGGKGARIAYGIVPCFFLGVTSWFYSSCSYGGEDTDWKVWRIETC